ncbi:TPA: glycosyltransferase family 4 protein [Burkholderia aenigmatica]|uniref:glycosyltransferase family 4 protein n=1 Tax=Burkholderia sp. AU45251 TaxID=3059204 RepID=UPI00264BCC3D|nr:glycosyltransferase family 4 protein [Burkholderia sp. AU45251]HDR9484639.1 glycosyltransferase family 4 protein [Burkholderia aenigmatica]MDN7516762.1 glycosyltransferase family 4 protein [Burkholderia sp. AU45251]HDR9515915.1 glycosyltransferase family 4 protein [Burkholderia aenigmatica]HDR9592724.1 glycosyltransferase family 4 protein [Burkholderia aenigmatica]HDR9599704.1 glycosyltransferase family 4 protein [Burkholderia aenigmatica]
MNILYTNFHGDYGGGQDTYVRDLAGAMSRHHRVTVASPEGSRLSRLLKDSPDVAIFDMEFKPRWNRLCQEVVRLRQRIVAERFDVIHVNGAADHRQVMLALLGCRYRPAVVLTKHNTYRADSFGNVLRARLATDHTIAVSDYVAGMLARQSPYGNVTVVKHGVRRQAAERLAGDEIRRRKIALFGPSAADAIVLGSSAGTAPEKGWMDLIAALGRLPEHERERFRVLLVGTEPTGEQREQIAHHRMAARTAFTGRVDDVRTPFSIVDVSFVLSYYESLSYACREAMALGCPAIVTRVGGLPENVEPGVDGWVVPPREPEAIEAILRAIVREPGCVAVMGRNARLKGKREFSFERFVDATLSIYQKSIRHNPYRRATSLRSV